MKSRICHTNERNPPKRLFAITVKGQAILFIVDYALESVFKMAPPVKQQG